MHRTASNYTIGREPTRSVILSALGQKQTYAPQKVMSALTPKADMCTATTDVGYGPKADTGGTSACGTTAPLFASRLAM